MKNKLPRITYLQILNKNNSVLTTLSKNYYVSWNIQNIIAFISVTAYWSQTSQHLKQNVQCNTTKTKSFKLFTWELAFSHFSTEKKEKGFLTFTVMNKLVLPLCNSLAPCMQARFWASTWKTAGWHILHAPSVQFTISLKNKVMAVDVKASKPRAKSRSR